MKRSVSILFILVFLFSACASPRGTEVVMPKMPEVKAARQTQEPEVSPHKQPPAAPPEVEKLTLPGYKPSAHKKPLPKIEPINPKTLGLKKGAVMINVADMPLSDFIIYALGETLKVPFSMEEGVEQIKTPVTLRMPRKVPAEKALKMVLKVLSLHGLTVREQAGALYISQSKQVQQQPEAIRIGRTVEKGPAQIVQIVPLKYIREGDAIRLIRELYRGKVSVSLYRGATENALLLKGTATSIKEVIDFINTIDIPYLKQKRLFLMHLTYWQIDAFIKQMTTILNGLGIPVARSPRQPGILFIPIKYLNSLLVICPDEKAANLILQWKERLDTPASAGTEEKAFTYIPKYSKASDLVEAISKLYGVWSKGKGASLVKTSGFKIAADDKRNIVVILTTPAQYELIHSLLAKLDRPPRQVLIQAMVAELTLTGELKYGLEWYIKNRMEKGSYTLGTLGHLGLTTDAGLTYQFISDTQRFQTIINAFASEGKINILSSPRLLVMDNEEATIQIGTDVPVVVGEVTGGAVTTPNILRNIQYRNTGVILRVRPTINTAGLLTLNISQEVSEMGANPPGINSPTILVRRVNTTVTAESGNTIVLGGLISKKTSSAKNKVPLLGDIPLLGNLFKTTTREKTKTELIILLTPRILTSVDETVNITNELKNKLKWLK